MMRKESLREQVERAAREVKKDPQAYDGVGESIEELEEVHGPYFGPRNDIERRKLIREIRESGKDDDQ